MALDNPAGRLHALLSEVRNLEHASRSITDTWASALGVPPSQVTVALAGVAGLLDDLTRLVSRLNDADAQNVITHFGPAWANALFAPGQQMRDSSLGLVDPGALAALGGLSALLTSTASEGVTPTPEQADELRDALHATLQEVLADTTTPPGIRTLLVARLHDMLWSLDHLATAGPEGVMAAVERLAGALLVTPQSERNLPLVKKVLAAAGRAWSVFTLGDKAQQSLEGWQQFVAQIGPGN